MKDKVINHVIYKEILLPLIEPRLINTNVATRENKGSIYAFNSILKYLNILKYNKKEIYILKIDINKYFYNIDHEILMNKLTKICKDKDVLNIVRHIINTTNMVYVNDTINGLIKNEILKINGRNISKNEKISLINQLNKIPVYKEGKGLPIGNVTSQTLAVFYLNDLDHYIKEILKCKYYIRYMDDLIILDVDKYKLRLYKEMIENELKNDRLTINKKSSIYKISTGFSFLGYCFSINHNNRIIIRYDNKTIYRIRRYLNYLYRYEKDKYVLSKNSYKGYFNRANTKLKDIILNKYND